VHEPFDHRVVVLAARIFHVVRADEQLGVPGHDLQPERAVRILGIDQHGEVRRDRHGKLLARQDQATALFLRQPEQLLELIEPGDPVTHLPSPVVPLFRLVAHTEKRAELLSTESLAVDRRKSLSIHLGFPPGKRSKADRLRNDAQRIAL
jgi:hypothetical protein